MHVYYDLLQLTSKENGSDFPRFFAGDATASQYSNEIVIQEMPIQIILPMYKFNILFQLKIQWQVYVTL